MNRRQHARRLARRRAHRAGDMRVAYPRHSEADLDAMTKADLLEAAQVVGITVKSRMRKADIIDAIRSATA